MEQELPALNGTEKQRMYEVKERIVKSGTSKVFDDWAVHEGITMEQFLDGLRWICDDPCTDGRVTRDIGCKHGKVVKITRAFDSCGGVELYGEDGRSWNRQYPAINCREKI